LRAYLLITGVYVLVQAVSLAALAPARAETAPATGVMPWEKAAPASENKPGETPAVEEAAVEPAAPPAETPEPAEDDSAEPPEDETETVDTPAAEDADAESPKAAEAEEETEATEETEAPEVTEAAEPAAPVPPHPVVAIIREKLGDAAIVKGAEDEDIAALKAFYDARGEPPLWITEMGFSAKGQSVLVEIDKADDWGLDAKDFALPDGGALPADETVQALAEIKLDLALLKYARHARGARHVPAEISDLFDQEPTLRDPRTVLTGIAASDTPDDYLRSLHPGHEQFARLQKALLEAREAEKPNETDIRRLVINMERWRWMPEELGAIYVWLNTPEFMLYVIKDGKRIFEDKTLVGTIGYPTPIFSDEMETIVFNPDWVAPPSVLQDKLWPALKRKHYSILKSNKLRVSYNGKAIDPTRIDWRRVNIHRFTFSQKAGPKNVLGKAKFLYPNKHIVYMHDTLPYRRKVFDEQKRAIGYGCVRMANPRQFAELMLDEDQDMPRSEVKSMWDKSVNKAVTIESKPPVHTTYFTAWVEEDGKVSTFDDLYGLDRKHAAALFGETDGFPVPPPEPKRPSSSVASTSSSSQGPGGGGFANSLGFFSN
jgi:L,D-transpeptidase YcbB